VQEERNELVGTSVTALDKEILRAVAFLERTSVSGVIYDWLRPRLEKAAQKPEVRRLLAEQRKLKPEPTAEEAG